MLPTGLTKIIQSSVSPWRLVDKFCRNERVTRYFGLGQLEMRLHMNFARYSHDLASIHLGVTTPKWSESFVNNIYFDLSH
ncbi:hypothetical protein LINGRAHAP2_LOCUS27303 [Linum grandiflorum]